MENILAKLVRRGLIGAVPLIAACSCPDRLVVRSPPSLASVPIAPTKDECKQICGERVRSCQRVLVVDQATQGFAWDASSQTYTIACTMPSPCVGGRRPAGLADAIALAGVGEHFAELARLEAASVVAFSELARELELHGAPSELVAWALRAVREEVTHAQLAGELARAYGAQPIAPVVEATPPRMLEAVLVENAVEGLVLERYGAALAAIQSTRAASPIVRDAMRAIAIDEASHAELSAAIHAWGAPRTSRAARSRISDARERARHELRAELDREPSAELAAIGLPSATLAIDLVA